MRKLIQCLCSAMELETAVRSKLPLIILVINNNGIYHGLDEKEFESSRSSNTLPSTALLPDTRYDLIGEAVGGRGWLAKNRVELAKALKEALQVKDNVSVINVMINPGGRTKLVSWVHLMVFKRYDTYSITIILLQRNLVGCPRLITRQKCKSSFHAITRVQIILLSSFFVR